MAIGDFFKRKKKDDILDLGAAPVPGGPGGYGPAAFPGMPDMQGFPQMPGQQQGQMPMDMGLPGMQGIPPPTPNFQQTAQMGSEQAENLRRSVEILNYKIDALKAAIDAINARLANIETALKAVPGEKQQEGWGTF